MHGTTAVLRALGLLICGAALSGLLSACNGGGTSGSPASPSGTGAASPTSPGSEASAASSPGAASGSAAGVSREQAASTVTSKYSGTVISVERDTEEGERTWEVEVKDSNQGRIEVDVSRQSGEIVSFEKED